MGMGRMSLLACGWALVAGVFALDAPTPHCATVSGPNEVTLTWTPPADPGGEFVAYEVHHAPSPLGPWAVIATIPVYATNSYVHGPIPVGSGPQFYFLTTVFGAGGDVSVPSDTVATIFLEVFQSVPLGNANIAWNAPALAPTAGGTFTVWMEYPLGTWTPIAQVPSTTFSYQHEIDICEDSLTFRVSLGDATDCASWSNGDGEVFRDVTPPGTPSIVAVSVDTASGQATITWSPSPQPDTQGYILLVVTPGGGIIIDTVYGQNTITYTWPNSSAWMGAESFTVAAFDTCYSGAPPSPNTSATGPPHTTIHAFTDYDPCSGVVDVNWTPYGGWTPWLYQVYVQESPVDCSSAQGSGPWTLLAQAGPGQLSVTQQTQPDRTYRYMVKAIKEEGGTVHSLSNKACRTTVYPGQPQFNYIRTATVSGPAQVTVVDSVDMSALVGAYRLERSLNGGPFEEVAVVGGSAGPVITFVDDAVEPERSGYRYRVVVVDSCGTDALVSNEAGTIVLRATASLDGTNLLEWNGYGEWAGVVSGYRVERSVDRGPYQDIALLPDFPWTFIDDVNALTTSAGRFCYRVVAVEAGNPVGINAFSVSNEACAVQEDLVYIPNAFVAGGVNNEFRPVTAYVDLSDYEFTIINRWGQVIWTSNVFDLGWDGKVGGQRSPEGIYAYYCRYRNGAGRLFEKRGTVMLLNAAGP
jgi:hypothetical protein